MRRDRVLKVVLVVVGVLFIAGVIPLTMFFSREPVVPNDDEHLRRTRNLPAAGSA